MAQIFSEFSSKIKQISNDFNVDVENNELDVLKTLDLTKNKIINVKDPVNVKDAVNKQYVDITVSNAINGIEPHEGVYYTKAETDAKIEEDIEPLNTQINNNFMKIRQTETAVNLNEGNITINTGEINRINNEFGTLTSNLNTLENDVNNTQDHLQQKINSNKNNIHELENLTGQNETAITTNTTQLTNIQNSFNNTLALKTINSTDGIVFLNAVGHPGVRVFNLRGDAYFQTEQTLRIGKIGQATTPFLFNTADGRLTIRKYDLDNDGDLDSDGVLNVEGKVTFKNNLDMINTRIYNVADPSLNQDATNKGYVDTLVSSNVTNLQNQINNIPANEGLSINDFYTQSIEHTFRDGNNNKDYTIFFNIPNSTRYNTYVSIYSECYNYTNESYNIYSNSIFLGTISPHKKQDGSVTNDGRIYVKLPFVSILSETEPLYINFNIVGNGTNINNGGNVFLNVGIEIRPAPPSSNTGADAVILDNNK